MQQEKSVKTDVAKRIFNQLKQNYVFPDDEDVYVKSCIDQHLALDWDETSVRRFVSLTEHVRPDLDESIASKRMQAIMEENGLTNEFEAV